MIISLDTETRSPYNIKEIGGYKMALDPFTIILCVCLHLANGAKLVWDCVSRDEKIQRQIIDLITDSKNVVLAHNGGEFDFPLLEEQWKIKIANPLDSLDLFRPYCSDKSVEKMDLDSIAKQFGLAKDLEGKEKMLLMSKPLRKYIPYPQATGDEEYLPIISGKMERLISYCAKDARLILEILAKIPDKRFSKTLIMANRERNYRGVRLDLDLMKTLISEAGIVESQILKKAEVKSYDKISSIKQFKQLMKAAGLELSECNKRYLKSLKNLTEDQQTLVDARLQIGKRVAAKFKKALFEQENGRLVNFMQWHKAHTGRYSSRGMQIHNLPRQKGGWKALEKIKKGHLETNEEIAALVRLCLLPDEGRLFFVNDYSSIEARLLAWIVGDEKKLQGYRNGIDFYVRMAQRIYQKDEIDSSERGVGKATELGEGYQMGPEKFETTLIAQGIDYSGLSPIDIVEAWRDLHPLVAGTRTGKFWNGRPVRSGGLWRKLKSVFTELCTGQMQKWSGYKVTFTRIGPDIFLTLPSGRNLFYRNARVAYCSQSILESNEDLTPTQKQDPFYRINGDLVVNDGYQQPTLELLGEMKALGYKPVATYGINFPIRTYGGALTENICQAIGLDLLNDAIEKCLQREIDYSFHVHDELVSQDIDRKNEIIEIMENPPSWAEGLPVATEGFITPRYTKEDPNE